MKKDRFGICLTFYAVLAFVLAILGQTLLGGLLLGFAILAVQDEWLTKQTMQAFFLSLISGLVSTIVSAISWTYNIPLLGVAMSGFFGVLTSIISLIILILAIVGLCNVARGKEAGIPLCKGFADKAFGALSHMGGTQGQNPPQA